MEILVAVVSIVLVWGVVELVGRGLVKRHELRNQPVRHRR